MSFNIKTNEHEGSEICIKELGKAGIVNEHSSSYDANYGAHKVGIKPQEMVDYYNKWKSYDEDLCPEIYRGPIICAEYTSNYLSGKHNSRILDVGAGSGRVGYELHQFGFKNIDALEPAQELFENSKYKSLYKKFVNAILGPQTVCSVLDDAYDTVVASGAFGEGHIPCTGLNDMIRIVKPGGYVIIVIREEYLGYVKEYKDRLEPYMHRLEEEGKWKKLERAIVKNYSFNKNGVVFVYLVTQAGF